MAIITIDDYLKGLPSDVCDALQALRVLIHCTVPQVQERIAYRIPVFSLKHDLVGFSAQKDPKKRQCSFYTMSPPLVKKMRQDLIHCRVSGATIHFTPDEPLSKSLVKKILRARVKELSEKTKKTIPKKSK